MLAREGKYPHNRFPLNITCDVLSNEAFLFVYACKKGYMCIAYMNAKMKLNIT